MSRFNKTGFIVVAIVGVLAIFSSFQTTETFGQAREPDKEAITLAIMAGKYTNISLTEVQLRKQAVIETVSGYCHGCKARLDLSTDKIITASFRVLLPPADKDIVAMSRVPEFHYEISPYLPPTTVGAPCGKKFNLWVEYYERGGANSCYLTLVVRYIEGPEMGPTLQTEIPPLMRSTPHKTTGQPTERR